MHYVWLLIKKSIINNLNSINYSLLAVAWVGNKTWPHSFKSCCFRDVLGPLRLDCVDVDFGWAHVGTWLSWTDAVKVVVELEVEERRSRVLVEGIVFANDTFLPCTALIKRSPSLISNAQAGEWYHLKLEVF